MIWRSSLSDFCEIHSWCCVEHVCSLHFCATTQLCSFTVEEYLNYILFGLLRIILWRFLHLKHIFGSLLLGVCLKENVLGNSICTWSDTVNFPEWFYCFICPSGCSTMDSCPHHLELSFLKLHHFNSHSPGNFVKQFIMYLSGIWKSVLVN